MGNAESLLIDSDSDDETEEEVKQERRRRRAAARAQVEAAKAAAAADPAAAAAAAALLSNPPLRGQSWDASHVLGAIHELSEEDTHALGRSTSTSGHPLPPLPQRGPRSPSLSRFGQTGTFGATQTEAGAAVAVSGATSAHDGSGGWVHVASSSPKDDAQSHSRSLSGERLSPGALHSAAATVAAAEAAYSTASVQPTAATALTSSTHPLNGIAEATSVSRGGGGISGVVTLEESAAAATSGRGQMPALAVVDSRSPGSGPGHSEEAVRLHSAFVPVTTHPVGDGAVPAAAAAAAGAGGVAAGPSVAVVSMYGAVTARSPTGAAEVAYEDQRTEGVIPLDYTAAAAPLSAAVAAEAADPEPVAAGGLAGQHSAVAAADGFLSRERSRGSQERLRDAAAGYGDLDGPVPRALSSSGSSERLDKSNSLTGSEGRGRQFQPGGEQLYEDEEGEFHESREVFDTPQASPPKAFSGVVPQWVYSEGLQNRLADDTADDSCSDLETDSGIALSIAGARGQQGHTAAAAAEGVASSAPSASAPSSSAKKDSSGFVLFSPGGSAARFTFAVMEGQSVLEEEEGSGKVPPGILTNETLAMLENDPTFRQMLGAAGPGGLQITPALLSATAVPSGDGHSQPIFSIHGTPHGSVGMGLNERGGAGGEGGRAGGDARVQQGTLGGRRRALPLWVIRRGEEVRDFCIEFYIIRHAEFEQDASLVVGGRSPHVPLTQRGEQQAHVLGSALREQGIQFREVISCPILRCLDTARIVCEELGMNPDTDVATEDALQEQSQGEWEGKTRADIRLMGMLPQITALQPDFAAPGGESQRQVEFRMVEFLTQLALARCNGLASSNHGNGNGKSLAAAAAATADSAATPAEAGAATGAATVPPSLAIAKPRTAGGLTPGGIYRIAIFSHSTAIKCLLRGILGSAPQFTHRIDIDHTSVTLLRYFALSGWRLGKVNDTAHLFAR